MKVIALVLVLVTVAAAAPQFPYGLVSTPLPPQVRVVPNSGASKDAVIVRYDSDNIGLGSYGYNVETSDGQKKEERGELVNPGTKDEFIAVQGKFSYPGPDGVLYEVVYVADQDGFRATGAHLPVAP
ncbi:hypothetical protein JTB14_018520 [Gonioctena quinquepunctata]|nr:hypothetical protein JTB14_018520 [Gonioctena quinquepunctata]